MKTILKFTEEEVLNAIRIAHDLHDKEIYIVYDFQANLDKTIFPKTHYGRGLSAKRKQMNLTVKELI